MSGTANLMDTTEPVKSNVKVDNSSNLNVNNFDPDEYELRKRLPTRFSTQKNDVYVTCKTDFKAQLARCQKLLDGGYDQVFVHGLGVAVNRAINLALQIKRRGLGSIDLDVNTSTIDVTDDLEPLMDHLDPKSHFRHVSAVHIRIFRPETPVENF